MTLSNRIVVAGAGTGKTYTLVETYLEALRRYRPHEILAITFTQKAASEMKARVITRVKELQIPANGLLSAPISTFHALCSQIVSKHFGNFTLLAPNDDHRLCCEIAENTILQQLDESPLEIGSLIARFNLRGSRENPGLSKILVHILQQIEESGQDPQKLPSLPARRSFDTLLDHLRQALNAFKQNQTVRQPTALRLESIEKAYQALIACSLDDEIAISACYRDFRELLSGRFGNDELRQALVEATVELGSALCCHHTKPDLLSLSQLIACYSQNLRRHKVEQRSFGFSDLLVLARDYLQEHPTQHKIVLVDEYQDTSPIQEQLVSLLSKSKPLFVVGDPKQSIYGFRGADASVFHRVQGTRDTLQKSYRSQSKILEFVNLIAASSLKEFETDEMLLPHRPALDNAGAIWKQNWVDRVSEVVSHRQPKDLTILVRRIKAARPLLEALNSAGIPARIFGGEGFYERQEIADLAAALMVLLEPFHPLARLILMRSPLWPCTDADLLEWHQKSLPPVFDTLRQSLGVLRVCELLDQLIEQTNYLEAIARESDADQRYANIQKLRLMFIDSQQNYDEKIRLLWKNIGEIPKESLAEVFDERENCINIMTIHQSKGLEFPVVILADLNSTEPSNLDSILYNPSFGLAVSHKNRPIALCAPKSSEEKKRFPTPIDWVRQIKRAQAEEEQPRLLYVALTRAKEAIYILDPEQPDRGPCLMRLIQRARNRNPELFDELLPAQ
ncbi:MAG: UvrD-helicase domain-containing protein [Myxococcaceae bacterium]|nr:UvrD-helicase domain-containing protein [Myxococcaceae bacterium]MBH2006578.1 UvrD-helicase domain-containing protein [Myxococcaceae bacterium]